VSSGGSSRNTNANPVFRSVFSTVFPMSSKIFVMSSGLTLVSMFPTKTGLILLAAIFSSMLFGDEVRE